MYLPRDLVSHLYLQLLRSHNPLSPPVLILVALEPDALCACRILTALLKRDYIQHKIQPIVGYGDLSRAGADLVRPMHTASGGSGGVVVCLGVGGLVDLSETLGLDINGGQEDMGGIQVWVIDARRPWNLTNVFGGSMERSTGDEENNVIKTVHGVERGRLTEAYKNNKGGIIVFDDGDIEEELVAERDAYCTLEGMPDIDDDGDESDGGDSVADTDDGSSRRTKKRKSWSDQFDDESEVDAHEDGPPRQRMRSNSVRQDPPY